MHLESHSESIYTPNVIIPPCHGPLTALTIMVHRRRPSSRNVWTGMFGQLDRWLLLYTSMDKTPLEKGIRFVMNLADSTYLVLGRKCNPTCQEIYDSGDEHQHFDAFLFTEVWLLLPNRYHTLRIRLWRNMTFDCFQVRGRNVRGFIFARLFLRSTE